MFEKKKALTSICPICENEREVHFGFKREMLTVRGENIEVNAKAFYCPKGDHYFSNLEFDEEKTQTAYWEYRNRKKIVQPDEIKQIRATYGLSQVDLGRLLGYGEKTIHRYETGAIPDISHNSNLRFIQDIENFIQLYEERKDDLPERLKIRIEERLLILGRDKHIRLSSSTWVDTTSELMYHSAAREHRQTCFASATDFLGGLNLGRYSKIEAGEERINAKAANKDGLELAA